MRKIPFDCKHFFGTEVLFLRGISRAFCLHQFSETLSLSFIKSPSLCFCLALRVELMASMRMALFGHSLPPLFQMQLQFAAHELQEET